jgi:4-hydroxyphenylacetate 3-monooxygenase
MPSLSFDVAGGGQVSLTPEKLIVAGYTARDEESARAHIAELAEIGVPPPASVPAYYDLDPALVTSEPVVEVDGTSTSGEVEPVIIRAHGRYFLGVGSDHTDRDLERTDIATSKAACPKPVGGTVVEIGADLSELDWDSLRAESVVDDRPYQKGSVATLRHPQELIERMTVEIGEVAGDLVLFCGTFALLGGEFVFGARWGLSLSLPDGRTLAHAYETRQTSA